MINDLPKYLIICLILTIFLETFLAIILKVRTKKDILNIILVNILTNPIVVIVPFLLNRYGRYARNISLFILELLTFITEGYIYQKTLKYQKIKPYTLSLILNLFSFGMGLLIKI